METTSLWTLRRQLGLTCIRVLIIWSVLWSCSAPLVLADQSVAADSDGGMSPYSFKVPKEFNNIQMAFSKENRAETLAKQSEVLQMQAKVLTELFNIKNISQLVENLIARVVQLEELPEKYIRQQKDLEALREKHDVLLERVADLESNQTQIYQTLETLEGEDEQIRGKVQEVDRNLRKKVADENAAITEIIQQNQRNHLQLASRVTNLRGDLQTTQDKLYEVSSKRDALEKSVEEGVKGELQNLEVRVDGLEKDVMELQKEDAEIESKVTDLATSRDEAREDIDALKKNAEDMEGEVTSIKANQSKERAKVESADKAINEQLNDLKRKSDDVCTEIEALKTENERQNARVDTLGKDLGDKYDKTSTEIESLKTHQDKQNIRVENLGQDLNSLINKKVLQLNTTAMVLGTKTQTLEEQVSNLYSKWIFLNNTTTALRTSVPSLIQHTIHSVLNSTNTKMAALRRTVHSNANHLFDLHHDFQTRWNETIDNIVDAIVTLKNRTDNISSASLPTSCMCTDEMLYSFVTNYRFNGTGLKLVIDHTGHSSTTTASTTETNTKELVSSVTPSTSLLTTSETTTTASAVSSASTTVSSTSATTSTTTPATTTSTTTTTTTTPTTITTTTPTTITTTPTTTTTTPTTIATTTTTPTTTTTTTTTATTPPTTSVASTSPTVTTPTTEPTTNIETTQETTTTSVISISNTDSTSSTNTTKTTPLSTPTSTTTSPESSTKTPTTTWFDFSGSGSGIGDNDNEDDGGDVTTTEPDIVDVTTIFRNYSQSSSTAAVDTNNGFEFDNTTDEVDVTQESSTERASVSSTVDVILTEPSPSSTEMHETVNITSTPITSGSPVSVSVEMTTTSSTEGEITATTEAMPVPRLGCVDSDPVFDNEMTQKIFQRWLTGAWMKDPGVPDDRVWVIKNSRADSIIEYNSTERLNGDTPNGHSIFNGFQCTGTGHVVYKGSLYCHKFNSTVLVKSDLKGRILTEAALPGMGIDNSYSYSVGGNTAVDFAVDEVGIWVLYSTEKEEGKLIVSQIDENSLEVMETWVTDIIKNETINAFMINGTLFALNSNTAGQSHIQYIYDTRTDRGRYLSPTTTPLLHNLNSPPPYFDVMVDYNPRDERLYVWRMQNWDGHLITFQLMCK
ncbi:uncharacterized protein LOC106165602 [Lingula anatina]|uniref:Uncharacterized protein LOC106165602 n=1 Tax=Lingula anatina TaxID=7574 RepID=A0A1S3IMJ3_LINAN|nr:uncharacterized protein LOC106165602 [Lingula anatina]|eukprot:XP_013399308.1 uncharacterized protein LOC106165602 [Lingula anatina]